MRSSAHLRFNGRPHGLNPHPRHLEGLTAKAYRATRGIQLIWQSRAEPAASADSLRSAALAAEPQAVRRHWSVSSANSTGWHEGRTVMKRIGLAGVLGACLIYCSTGCAFGNRHVTLTYPPQHVAGGRLTAVAEAASPPAVPQEKLILVTFLDQRPNRSAVGAVHNGFGMHTADVLAQNSVADWVVGAVAVELEKAGFTVAKVKDIPPSPGLPVVTGEILKVYCAAYMRYESDVSFAIRVESNGKEILRKTYQGQIDSMTNWGASAKSYGQALSLALETAAKSFAAELRRDLRATN
jgi:hypothetical protein